MTTAEEKMTREGLIEEVNRLRRRIEELEQSARYRVEVERRLRDRQKMEAIGALAGGIAHEFNNILMGITCCAHLVMRTVEEGSQAHQDLVQINQLTERGASLTRQLLAFSRRRPVDPVLLGVNAAVKTTLGMLRRLIEENVEIRFIPGEGVGNVLVDPAQLEQVLTNLVVNARDAMPAGGAVTVRTERVAPDREHLEALTGPAPSAFARISVHDTGRGMSETVRDRAFEPFFTTKEVGKGSGLGLAVVHGIVQRHGGYVRVESRPNRGSAVHVHLPLVETEAEGADARDILPGGSETILVVDDEDLVRSTVSRVLADRGYAVLSAGSADEAERLCEDHPEVDLLITDVVMPRHDGRELARRLAARRPQMKVLYMSGYPETLLRVRDEMVPERMLIAKPISPVALARKVRQVLDGAAG